MKWIIIWGTGALILSKPMLWFPQGAILLASHFSYSSLGTFHDKFVLQLLDFHPYVTRFTYRAPQQVPRRALFTWPPAGSSGRPNLLTTLIKVRSLGGVSPFSHYWGLHWEPGNLLRTTSLAAADDNLLVSGETVHVIVGATSFPLS